MTAIAMAALLVLTPGVYLTPAGTQAYVAVQHELPDAPTVQAYNPQTGRLIESPLPPNWRLQQPVREQRSTVATPQGTLGVSLYYADSRKRAAIILIHGNDAETREMGFIIPYFVAHGINVISYDQRGTGTSDGNWQMSGPAQRATDVDYLVDAYASNQRVDPKRIGVWAFSNGGWTAPLVATQRPIAFIILKSAPVQTLADNIIYESKQRMLRYGEDRSAVASAAQTWRLLLSALCDKGDWTGAARGYAAAEKASWFQHSLLPPNLKLPLRGNVAAGYRNFACYDPKQTLSAVKTPTLAMYGSRDRAVNVARDSQELRSGFGKAGMPDFTMHVYSGAAHTLELSRTGFVPDVPERYVKGYPEVMIDWLARRGFLKP